MNLGQMQDELGYLIRDNGALTSWLLGWINDAILEVATDYDLKPLALVTPYEIGVDTTNWLWSLPDSFHKNLFMAKRVNTDGTIHRIHHIHKDYRHLLSKDHTITGDNVRELAVIPQGLLLMLGVHPLAVDNLNLWFYQKPAVLSNASDVCDCIPFNFIPQVIYPKIIIKNYQFIVDQVTDFPFTAGPLQYWQGELSKGLFGARGQGTGLMGYFQINFNPPRRTGGRDPIGWRPYYYGSGM